MSATTSTGSGSSRLGHSQGGLQARWALRWWPDEEQVQMGALHPALDIDTLAYTIIRVAGPFPYSDVIAGSEPDVGKAVDVVRLMLHAPPLPSRK